MAMFGDDSASYLPPHVSTKRPERTSLIERMLKEEGERRYQELVRRLELA
jgi:hypothetical protein